MKVFVAGLEKPHSVDVCVPLLIRVSDALLLPPYHPLTMRAVEVWKGISEDQRLVFHQGTCLEQTAIRDSEPFRQLLSHLTSELLSVKPKPALFQICVCKKHGRFTLNDGRMSGEFCAVQHGLASLSAGLEKKLITQVDRDSLQVQLMLSDLPKTIQEVEPLLYWNAMRLTSEIQAASHAPFDPEQRHKYMVEPQKIPQLFLDQYQRILLEEVKKMERQTRSLS
jgi:hypothetical protein